MIASRLRAVLATVMLATGSAAWADEPAAGDSVELRLQRLERENRELRKIVEETRGDVAQLRDDHAATDAQVKRLLPLGNLITGYLDVGFFWVGGDGSGIRPDIGYLNFPEYRGLVPDSWVFMGDPLSTAINSRGDPADTGPSRAVTFNPIGNGGKATFLVNALTLTVSSAPMENLQVFGLVDFVPRGRNVSNSGGLFLGDYIDVKLGYAQYDIHTPRANISLFAGKFDSIVGYEYRIQEAPDRITVTPSLICRYICGRPVGLKMRALFLDERLALAVGVTNGSQFVETFPFYDEIDTNYFKTISARLSYKLPVGAGLEVGASGAFGAQDFQPDDNVFQWHYGFDAHLEIRGFDLTAEFVQGAADGKSEAGMPRCGVAACLRYKGAYGLIGYRAQLAHALPARRLAGRAASERRQLRLHHRYRPRHCRLSPRVRHQRHPQGRVRLRSQARSTAPVLRRYLHQLAGGKILSPSMRPLLAPLFLLVAARAHAADGRVSGNVVTVDKSGHDRPRGGVVISLGGLPPATAAPKSPPRIRQRDTQFDPALTVITVGTTVEFPNDDKIFHNVFSLSEAGKFDLGLYKSGTAKSVTFRRPGVVDLYCNIHPQMVAKIKVLENDYWALTRADGSFTIEHVPPGSHPITAWQPNGDATDGQVTVSPGGTVTIRLTLPEPRPGHAHLRKDGTPYGRYK